MMGFFLQKKKTAAGYTCNSLFDILKDYNYYCKSAASEPAILPKVIVSEIELPPSLFAP